MKSSRLPPSAHCISTLFGGDKVIKLRGGKGKKRGRTAVSVLLDRKRRIELFLTMRGWRGAFGSVYSKRQEKRAYVLVCNDVRVM